MRLIHYGSEPLILDRTRTYDQTKGLFKPRGLWVSVEGPDDWPSWCLRNFRIETLAFQTEIVLVDNPKIARITTDKELLAFDSEFTARKRRFSTANALDHLTGYGQVNWDRAAQRYDGIIIAPYLWNMRLGGPTWYYGWDCASGCIWNLNAIYLPKSYRCECCKRINSAAKYHYIGADLDRMLCHDCWDARCHLSDTCEIDKPPKTCDCCGQQRASLPYHHDSRSNMQWSWDYCQECWDAGCDLTDCAIH